MRVNKSTIRRTGLILAVLMCFMSLSGCYSVMGTSNSGSTIVQQESAPYVDTGEADSAVAEDAIQEDDGERAYVLYFPNEDYTRLTVEVAYKAAAEGKSREETAIDLLLAGPSSDDLRPVFGEGVKVTRYEQSLDLMNIYFTPELLNMSDEDILRAQAAVANTLTELGEIKRVAFFCDGRLIRVGNQPLMPGQAIQEELDAYIMSKLIDQFMLPEEITQREVVLYFTDANKRYMLPETRTVRFTSDDNADYILDALFRGPSSTEYLSASVSFKLEEGQKTAVSRDGRGYATVEVPLSQDYVTDFAEFDKQRTLELGAIVYSLTGSIDQVRDVKFICNGERVLMDELDVNGDGRLSRLDFLDYVGNRLVLYYPDKQMTGLQKIQRIISCNSYHDIDMRLQELLKGPSKIGISSSEGNLTWPVDTATQMPGFTTKVEEDILYIDFDSSFYNLCVNSLTQQQEEYLTVYAIVNTMTEVTGIRRVAFLRDGQPVETLKGNIRLSEPLMRNPGVILNSGTGER